MRALFLFLALCFASMNANAAHELAATIQGQVVDANKQPVAGVLVVVEHLDTGRVQVRLTNSKGRYHAPNVRPDGTYRVTAMAESGKAYSFTMADLRHGHDHSRNFVIDYEESAPRFERSWKWNMDNASKGIWGLK